MFGLLTNAEGCPVAVEVFDDNTGDPKTVASQVNKLRERLSAARGNQQIVHIHVAHPLLAMSLTSGDVRVML